MTAKTVHLGFEVGAGKPVVIPIKHMVVTGQTQESGKTTTLEALIARSEMKALAFVTKRGEGSFNDAQTIQPYFRERADWKYVAAILEASRGEKLKYERAWIIRASKGARTLADVQSNVREALKKAKGQNENAYLCLDAYLEDVVPYIGKVKWADKVNLETGVNVMELERMPVEMQHLVLRSSIEWILDHEKHTLVVVPEAWKFIPQGRGTPVQLAAESFIRQAAGLGNYLWLDSQDIAGVQKIILKSVPIWLLGVQRESNEVERTLAQIPAGTKKPKAEEVATLQLGQFFACWGTHVIKTYVQPAWMTGEDAIAIAQGKSDAYMAPRPRSEWHMTRVNSQTGETQRADLDNAKLDSPAEAMLKDSQHAVDKWRDDISVGDTIIEPDNTPKPEDYGTMPAGLDYYVDDGGKSVDQQERERYTREISQWKHRLYYAERRITGSFAATHDYDEWDKSEAWKGALIENPKPQYAPPLIPDLPDSEEFIKIIVDRVLARIPAGGTIKVEPREVVLKRFQQEEVTRILNDAESLSSFSKQLIAFLEARNTGVKKSAAVTSVTGKRFINMARDCKQEYEDIRELAAAGFIREDTKNSLVYPNLGVIIKRRLAETEPTNEDVDNIIGQVMLKLK